MKNNKIERGLPLYEYYDNAINVSGYTPIYSMLLVLGGVAVGITIGATGLYYAVMLFGGTLSFWSSFFITAFYAFLNDTLKSANYYAETPK